MKGSATCASPCDSAVARIRSASLALIPRLTAHRRMLRLCGCERPCEVTAAAQVHAVSPLTISALRRAIAAEPAYTRALQLPQATAVAVPT